MKLLPRIAAAAAALVFAATSLTACAATDSHVITVVVHDSVSISKELLAQFKNETGITVKLLKAGDAGAMTNKLVLTKDAPIGDAVYGIDNTFASVATLNQIIDGELTAIDFGDVCFNYDKDWFAHHELAVPSSLDDLIKRDYQGLTVVENPSTSSTGMAFLAAAVSKYGTDGWQSYLTALKNNDVKITAGWEDAYYTDFSGSSGKGAYPIVLSYSSSPADEVRDATGESQTAAVLSGCFRQTEYAGVLAKSAHSEDARKFIDFMLSEPFQSAIPGAMYMYPIDKTVALPETWAQFAPAATAPIEAKVDIAANRESWLKSWAAIFN